MHASPFYVLDDAGNEDFLPIAHGVYLALFALHVLVDQHRPVRGNLHSHR